MQGKFYKLADGKWVKNGFIKVLVIKRLSNRGRNVLFFVCVSNLKRPEFLLPPKRLINPSSLDIDLIEKSDYEP